MTDGNCLPFTTFDRDHYPALLSPLKVGRFRMSNRVIMGAMHTGIEKLDHPLERITAFYKERVDGEVAMIVTGGVAPSPEGRIEESAPVIGDDNDNAWHRAIVDSVSGSSTLVCMQLLHAGRYAKIPECVAPSPLKASINRYSPKELSVEDIRSTIDAFVAAAARAHELGYHGVEIMGSEGYLINQFTAPVTNLREDEFGGSFENRCRFVLEIIRGIKARLGDRIFVMFRLSVVDLVEGGMSGDEAIKLAKLAEKAGADIINTGVGWHESRVPTVAHVVPRAAWAYATAKVAAAVACPVVASNRINDPQVADELIASQSCDLVSMARPLLADAAFVSKARAGRAASINTCIACNQACLDRGFRHESVSCLVNPRAARETDFVVVPAQERKCIGVIGAGAAGLNFAFNAAARGHQITLYEAGNEVGGQLLMARNIPDKSEFDEMLRYFRQRLVDTKVTVHLNARPGADEILKQGYDEIVIATGVSPREINIPGMTGSNVLTYIDILRHGRDVGQKVAIIGAGGIAYDTAEYLLGDLTTKPEMKEFSSEFGIDLGMHARGGLVTRTAVGAGRRSITMLQRSPGTPSGNRKAVTTNWIKRDRLRRQGVRMLGGVAYQRISDQGIHVSVEGKPQLIAADTVVLCVGQVSERTLRDQIFAKAPASIVHLIGGADQAVELDAMRAIEQATLLALSI